MERGGHDLSMQASMPLCIDRIFAPVFNVSPYAVPGSASPRWVRVANDHGGAGQPRTARPSTLSGRHRVLKHLALGVPVRPEQPRRRARAHTIDHACPVHSSVQLHLVHPLHFHRVAEDSMEGSGRYGCTTPHHGTVTRLADSFFLGPPHGWRGGASAGRRTAPRRWRRFSPERGR